MVHGHPSTVGLVAITTRPGLTASGADRNNGDNMEHEHDWRVITDNSDWQYCFLSECDNIRRVNPGIGWVEYAPVVDNGDCRNRSGGKNGV